MQSIKNEMAYLVIAYPELSPESFDKIQNYRSLHDGLYYRIVNPHFTLAFSISDIPEKKFIGEIKRQAFNFKLIKFILRCATINKDAFSEFYHTFLVPDEGYSKIVRLHDRLYSDILKNNLRLDIDFVPHIGIGNSKDKFTCKKMVDEWNSVEFSIEGTINSLTIVKYENNLVSRIQDIVLKKV